MRFSGFEASLVATADANDPTKGNMLVEVSAAVDGVRRTWEGRANDGLGWDEGAAAAVVDVVKNILTQTGLGEIA